jgi:hypothetical protein
VTRAAQVSLQRWLRRQLRQPTPEREHLDAAVAVIVIRANRGSVSVNGDTLAVKLPE